MGSWPQATGDDLGFISKRLAAGILFNAESSMYPTKVYGFTGGEIPFSGVSSTCFGIVTAGTVKISRPRLAAIDAAAGMYFCAPGPVEFSGDGECMIIERIGYRGLFSVGGPLEPAGRLRYIDHCSATQLVPPARLGDPTLQFLHFPPNTRQSMHIHPTIRCGYVFSGHGKCISSTGAEFAIESGSAFLLEEGYPHCFHSGDKPIAIVVYHPDTDVGPTDQSHPMLSRTYLDR
jgi:hypothetical protein